MYVDDFCEAELTDVKLSSNFKGMDYMDLINLTIPNP